jgi:hypothetical protein
MPFRSTSSPPSGVLLAEAVTFDPGLVVAAFLVFLLVCAGAIAVVVVGIVSGVRSARAPDLRRPLIAWRSCVAIEAAVALLATVAMAPVLVLVVAWAALGSSVAARWLARTNPPAP